MTETAGLTRRVLAVVAVLLFLAPAAARAGKPLNDCFAAAPSPAGRVQYWLPRAQAGEALAQLCMGGFYYNGTGVPLDFAEAAKWYRKAADQDNALAQVFLAVMYENGLGVLKDVTEAAKWYRKAAEQGNAAAQYNLGVRYANGQGVPQDDAEALKWYEKAADQGLAEAQSELGAVYATGRGVAQNDAQAAKWFRKAADQGVANAEFSLGRMYYLGEAVPQDYATAVRWFGKAADQDYPEAQFNLGVMYENARGEPQDYAQAVKWYRKAADQGYALAQFNLAVMYESGRGVPKDDMEAAKWYREAADQGDTDAQYHLGVMYTNGLGVPQDDAEALKWYNKAAKTEAARQAFLQRVAQSLTRERQTSARSQARIELLNQQILALRLQLQRIAEALNAAEAKAKAKDQKAKDQEVVIANLGKRLNMALANLVQELERYRSDFFGRLREVLGNRKDIRIEGDRFVFQSEVLFASGSAVIGEEGGKQLAEVAATLLDVASHIPPEINWILRVDGHTDRIPIHTDLFPSNWQLSTARAISVVQFLIAQGVPPERLAAAGFGEFQPIDPGDTEEAYRRNRRIELELTTR